MTFKDQLYINFCIAYTVRNHWKGEIEYCTAVYDSNYQIWIMFPPIGVESRMTEKSDQDLTDASNFDFWPTTTTTGCQRQVHQWRGDGGNKLLPPQAGRAQVSQARGGYSADRSLWFSILTHHWQKGRFNDVCIRIDGDWSKLHKSVFSHFKTRT